MKKIKTFINKLDSLDIVLIVAIILYSEILFVTLLKTIQ
jgi:hypothetical protein